MINFVGQYQEGAGDRDGQPGRQAGGDRPGFTPSGSAPYLRSLAVIGNETPFGQSIREPTNRSNTYFAPGEPCLRGPRGSALGQLQ